MARILVVDDNETNLRLTAYLLAAFGHEPLAVPDAEMAFALLSAERFDLILMDIVMPGVDGYQFAEEFKRSNRAGETPIVALTALAMVGDEQRILDAGFNSYIGKPIDPETFVPQIERFLAASAAR